MISDTTPCYLVGQSQYVTLPANWKGCVATTSLGSCVAIYVRLEDESSVFAHILSAGYDDLKKKEDSNTKGMVKGWIANKETGWFYYKEVGKGDLLQLSTQQLVEDLKKAGFTEYKGKSTDCVALNDEYKATWKVKLAATTQYRSQLNANTLKNGKDLQCIDGSSLAKDYMTVIESV